jgi:hypothetical protein
MEPEGSLPCSQQPASGPYPEPDESRTHLHAACKINFNITLLSTTTIVHYTILYYTGAVIAQSV